MDISFSTDELSFRDEVRAFLKQTYTDELKMRLGRVDTYKQAQVDWQKRLYEKGWIAPDWPLEYGGVAWSPTQCFIFEAERAAVGAPESVSFGLKMIGPLIYRFGTDEQKKRFLPRILSSDDWWCQGYSEAGAGSDLAALQTKAVLDGDNYIVNGTKIWTTYAQYADWIFCLVRTSSSGKRQDGITFLLIDMQTPGITVTPIDTIDDHHSINEVRFNEVRVPVANRIGEQDKGWTYAKSLLTDERSATAHVGTSKYLLKNLRALLAQENALHKGAVVNSLFHMRLAKAEIELMALEYTELRILAALAQGKTPGQEASLLKIKGTEILQALHQLYLDLAAYYSGLTTEHDDNGNAIHSFANKARKDYMYGRACTIYAGSNEIQKNIIARHVLGLC